MAPYLNLCVLILSFLSLGSCNLVHYLGTKAPEFKSQSEVESYLQQQMVAYDHLLLLGEAQAYLLDQPYFALNLWKLEQGVAQSTIQVRIFNSQGILVNAYSQCYGNLERVNIFESKDFTCFDQFPNNYALTLGNELNHLIPNPLQSKAILEQSKSVQYTLMVYWNIWSNHYSRIILKKLNHYLTKYDMKKNCQIILINTDNASKIRMEAKP